MSVIIFRDIALLSVAGNVVCRVIQNRMKERVDQFLSVAFSLAGDV